MGIKVRWVRLLLRVGACGVGVLLMLVGAVRVQHFVLRYRCERLLKDFQGIRLHESTWADAQRLMTRWGAWGHYEGTCTAVECGYTITLEDFTQDWLSIHAFETLSYPIHQMARLERKLFGNLGAVSVKFRVQDGVILRSSIFVSLSIPAQSSDVGDFGYGVMVVEKASQSLYKGQGFPWIMGDDEQLVEHPDYKVGSPSGCEICYSVEATFAPAIAAEELKRISAFDFSCFTSFRVCRTPVEVLPVAREWTHWAWMTGAESSGPGPAVVPHACAIPLFARARDADAVLVVEVLSRDRDTNRVEARVKEVWKGGAFFAGGFAGGDRLSVTPWATDSDEERWKLPEHLEAGKGYVLFLKDRRNHSATDLDYCGLVEESEVARAQVRRGLAQNDALRHVEEDGKVW